MFTTDMPRMLKKKIGSKTVGMHVEQRTSRMAEPGCLAMHSYYITSGKNTHGPWGGKQGMKTTKKTIQKDSFD